MTAEVRRLLAEAVEREDWSQAIAYSTQSPASTWQANASAAAYLVSLEEGVGSRKLAAFLRCVQRGAA